MLKHTLTPTGESYMTNESDLMQKARRRRLRALQACHVTNDNLFV